MNRNLDKRIKEARQRGEQDYVEIKTGCMEFFICCDCHLRHIIRYEVVRGIKPEEDMVKIYLERDDMGTELMREYRKKKKKKPKRRK